METISLIGACIGIFTAICALFLNLQILHEHKRKKFKAELENYEEYFSKYYNSTNEIPKLIKDKAAQNLTRSPAFTFDLVNYFIKLHESSLVSFDKIIDHFYWGNNFILVKKNEESFNFSLTFKYPIIFKYFNYLGYIIFILFAILFQMTNLNNIPFPFWLKVIISLGSIMMALICLKRADDISESIKFIKLIKDSELIN